MLAFLPLFLFSLLSPSLYQVTEREERRDCFFSPNGKYYALLTYGKGNSEFVPFRAFSLRNKEGTLIWQSDSFPYTLIDLSNEGWTVGIFFDGPISGRAHLHFYDDRGRKRGEEEIGFLNARTFSENGKIYAVLDGKNGLRIFNREGKELYRLGFGNYFALSPDGKICALAQDTEIVFFTDGKRFQSLPLTSPFIRQMKFFQAKTIFGYLTKKDLFLYRISEGSEIFHYAEKEPNWRLVSFDLEPDKGLVILGRGEDKGRGEPERHTQGEVRIFDFGGKVLWRERLRYKNWNIFVPEVKFLGKNSFLVKTAEEIYEYRY
uniref:WD40 repeat domain-containing protein n=1 Tax=candidate division WOR-3 bacterium TaxID=2052148 RepID=A0A7C3YT49_UNCW3